MVDDNVDLNVLRHLDVRKNGKYGLVVVVDGDLGLRGIDARAPSNSILFLTLRSFKHQREMQ